MSRAAVDKGWVRDGILSSLSKGPRNPSEIARELGVSKATVSYHTKSLLRKGMIEISEVRTVKGGVYSKTFALKPGGTVLAHRMEDQEASLDKLDELFEKMLLDWHLKPERAPADEVKIFLYHAFRLLAMSDALDDATLQGFGARVGEELISKSLEFATAKSGMKELVSYLGEAKMADMRLETNNREALVFCSSCFENSEHGSPVCAFTEGLVEGVLRAKMSAKFKVEREDDLGVQACRFTITWRKVPT